MKTFFIINPKAGTGKKIDDLASSIEQYKKKSNADIETYLTKSIGDAERFVRAYAEEHTADHLRFIACGGDGTFNEVLNGAYGFSNVSLGIVPIGTGNDFCRNFKQAGDFFDIDAQINGTETYCDAIRYSGLLDGVQATRYCANMFNIGFDCNTADLAATLKKYPLIAGSLAYLLAVLVTLIKKKGAELTVKLDGEVCHDGKLLLCALANGICCGGGIKSSPDAVIDDGLMDVNVIYNISRGNFLKKFPYYSKGTHRQLPDIDEILLYKRCQKAVITPKNGTMRLCADGEIVSAGEITFEMVPHAFRMIIPAQ